MGIERPSQDRLQTARLRAPTHAAPARSETDGTSPWCAALQQTGRLSGPLERRSEHCL